MKEDAFLKACFYGQIKKGDDNKWIIGDNVAFKFEIQNEEEVFKQISDDDYDGSYKLKLKWHRKEWDDDKWSTVTLEFEDDEDSDKKCDLKLKQKGIPNADKFGHMEQPQKMKELWENTIFKGLTV